ncbi:MAG: hypothetical protein HYU88_07840 [Chloroflexi bacterium]|nr:hypothetical protein [Chloroflexota bacterium]
MSLLDAVRWGGVIPDITAPQATKKRYSEVLSKALAEELAEALRSIGFRGVRPSRGGPGDKEFQGGLGPMRVDISFSDERHGLLLAISVKTICFRPYGKNLKNRFGDLCTEAITLHMRFPYSVVCAIFAMPGEAHLDATALRRMSTFQRASMLLGTITGRADHASAGERFEDVMMLLFQPLRRAGDESWIRLYAADRSGELRELTEDEYIRRVRDIYNARNPHAQIGTDALLEE